jgi:hypothetical protein
MKERPILFSAPMVRAILDGRKTQTRRVMKPQPQPFEEGPLVHAKKHPAPYIDAYNGGPVWVWWTSDDRQGPGNFKCPFGVPGDRLWVRETFAMPEDVGEGPDGSVYYRATDPGWDDNDSGVKWRSPLFMPRDASRITLEITGVRVQRVQEINTYDALCEGMEPTPWIDTPGVPSGKSECDQFQDLWVEINGGKSWDKNEWVWVIEFKRLEAP